MILPTFVGLGAQRAATTWIHECLREHPEVFVPDVKELHYFDENFERGIGWYASHFGGGRDCKAIGEVTPNYLDVKHSIPRMADLIPEARLFVVLREPAERAYSAYKLFRKRYGWTSFPEACNRARYLVEMGMYSSQIENIYQYYPKGNLLVVLYDDIEERGREVIQGLYEHLGVNSSFVPDAVGTTFNQAALPGLQAALGRTGLGWSIDLFKRTALGQGLKNRLRARTKSMANLGDRAHIDYLRGCYRTDVQRLQEVIGRDLSHWID